MTKNRIFITVLGNNREYFVETYRNEYNNLMMLLKDKELLDCFGECCGMGKCATCAIKINGLSGNSITKERNEPVTLGKIGYTEDNIRLACQLFITEDLNNVVVELL